MALVFMLMLLVVMPAASAAQGSDPAVATDCPWLKFLSGGHVWQLPTGEWRTAYFYSVLYDPAGALPELRFWTDVPGVVAITSWETWDRRVDFLGRPYLFLATYPPEAGLAGEKPFAIVFSGVRTSARMDYQIVASESCSGTIGWTWGAAVARAHRVYLPLLGR